jgi:outer membrane protein OmpA-like peptidoglycan-associated protein
MGPAGAPGPQGEIGARGRVGTLYQWTAYREFWFDSNEARIHQADKSKVLEIATYMNNNPSLQLGIDGSLDPQNNNSRDQALSNRRVNAIRDALVKAGVPANRIRAGAFGDVELRRDGRVEVLLITGQLTANNR